MSEKVSVTVEYVGKADFVVEVPASTALQSIKVRAMGKFELDPGSADEYVLQYNATDLDDKSHIGALRLSKVTLTLMLLEEVPKG